MKITDKSQDLENFIQAILSQEIKVGEVIRQRDLCEVLSTSLTPLRELLVLLEELDLVEVRPSAGYKIIYPDIDFMRENMQFRVMIEQHAIDALVVDAQDVWIDEQMEKHECILKSLETHKNVTENHLSIIDFDRSFHRTIVGSLNNRAISKAHEYAQIKLRIARRVHRRVPPRKANIEAMHEHINFLGALKTRDLNAVKAKLDDHFASSIRNTMLGF